MKKKTTTEPVAVASTALLAHGCDRCSLKGRCRAIRAASKEHFRWTLHNMVAHPLSELAWLVGLRKLSNWLHDASIPKLRETVSATVSKCAHEWHLVRAEEEHWHECAKCGKTE